MQQSLRSAVRFVLFLILGLACRTPLVCTASAAEGDTFFSTPGRQIFRTPDILDGGLGTDSSINVFFNIEGPAASLPAGAWTVEMTITPLPGSTGSVVFDPPPFDGFVPNLDPSSVNPFLDFDLDFGGKVTGELGDAASYLTASAIYFPPTLGPAPEVDGNGNLTLPNGAGLFSVPIHMASGTSGEFLVSFGVDPQFNGVSFATSPTTSELYPVSQNPFGMLSVIEGVPEPTTAILAAMGCLILLPGRRRRR